MRTIRLTVVSAALITGAVVLGAHLGAFENEPTRVIPLNRVYATFAQDNLRSAEAIIGQEILESVDNTNRAAPRRIALCVGADATAAVRDSAKAFALPEKGVPSVQIDSNHTLWLAAYLGTDGSVPSAYRLESIEIRDKTIRVTYESDESGARSCDLHDYLLWAPLNRVESGRYTLELFDSTINEVTASREWQVIAK
jgi:hypothetical protein